MKFAITEGQLDSETHVVELYGDIDMATAPRLRAALDAAADAGKRRLVVDLTGVRFFDSTGLRALVAARNRVHPEGGWLVVVCPDATVRRTFELTGMCDTLNVVSSHREAVAALAGQWALTA